MHEIKAKLGPKRQLLNDLVSEQIIQPLERSYLPRLCAITEFEDPDKQAHCLRCIDAVLQVLKTLYVRDGDRQISSDEVIEAVKSIEPHALQDEVRIGIFFATEFAGCFSGWGYDACGAVTSVKIAEGILDFENVQAAWSTELNRRNTTAAQATAMNLTTLRHNKVMYDPTETDPLVDVYSRRRYDADIPSFIADASNKAPLAMLYLDLDHFKEVNDEVVHSGGDDVLKQVVSEIRSAVLGKGICYRRGGDEFLVILPNYDTNEALSLSERICRSIEGAKLGTDRAQVTVSIGVAAYPGSTDRADQLVDQADAAMYRAKRDGGNCVRKAVEESA